MLYRSEKHFGLGIYIHYYHMALILPMENLSTVKYLLPFLGAGFIHMALSRCRGIFYPPPPIFYPAG